MECSDGKKEINWNVGIPVVLWIGILALSIVKVCLSNVNQISVKLLLNTFNTNTFSTFMSIIMCMLYQYFSVEKYDKREEISHLRMKKMPIIIIFTIVYAVLAIFDSAIDHGIMVTIFFSETLYIYFLSLGGSW